MSVKFHPDPRRILVRGVNWLGDAVMTTPALLRLREKFPGAHIAILTPEKISELWKSHPAVDEVISFKAEENIFAVAGKLREGSRVGVPKIEIRDGGTPSLPGKFDLALVLPNSPRSALEVFLAGIPQRIGYSRPWRNLFLTQAVASRARAVKMHKRTAEEIRQLVADNQKLKTQDAKLPSSAHQVHEYLHLAAALGANPEPLAPQLAVTAEEIGSAKKKFGLENISQPVFGLNPGAEYGPAKRWPAEKFIAAAKEIQKQTNCVWLIFGGKGDVALAERIESALRTPHSALQNMCGRTSLRELMALLKCCRVLLTNDTGPMHVASALGTAVVVPFGSTSPELTGPIFSPNAKILKSDAPCSPCFLRECPIDFRCMNGIAIESVVEAVLQSVR
ncbi:MAG TPA: lipopolysaccharide heptosyltransferase II [Candidatus Sulfotelmatobacter sp.]|jgi:heptosyltransferase-2|nr:lipopolysaccharide heptosyltransferase II [Candidatus Sulfotelmatobacter sp.]